MIASSNYPAALLDQDGMHVIELNHAAEYAGIQPGMSTSQAIARASELVLYKRNLSNEQHLQNSLLQLVYRYSPFIENSAPGICTLDLKGKRIRNHRLAAGIAGTASIYRPQSPGRYRFESGDRSSSGQDC